MTASSAQEQKLLWKEDLKRESFFLLGKGIYHYLTASHYGGKKAPFQTASFERALNLSPDSYLLLDGLGWVLFKRKDYLQAANTFQRALKFNADGADSLEGLAYSAEQRNDLSEEENWTIRLAAAQNSKAQLAQLWNHRGIEAYDRKDYATAVVDFRKATDLAPGKSVYLTNISDALAHNGEFTAAKEILENALRVLTGSNDQQELNDALAYVFWWQAHRGDP